MKKILIYGVSCYDIVVYVSSFPQPDEKIRSNQTIICGGGNGGNTTISLSKLNHSCTLITKFGNDLENKERVIKELERYHINLDYCCYSSISMSSFTYVIIYQHTRTCIHTPLNDDITNQEILEQIQRIDFTQYKVIHYDSRLTRGAVELSKYLSRSNLNQNIIQTIDLERDRKDLNYLLKEMNVIFTNPKGLSIYFPILTSLE